MNDIIVQEAKFEEIPLFSKLLCQGFNDKFPIIFKGLTEEEYTKLVGDMLSSVYNNMSFRGNYLATYKDCLVGSIKLKYKGAGKEPMKEPWNILKRRLGLLKAIRDGILLDVFLSSKVSRGELYIEAICVDSNYRSKGIGSKMLQFAEDLGKELGLKYLTLKVIGKNLRAKALYEKYGFKVEKFHKTWLGKKVMGIADYYDMKKEIE